MKVFLSIGTGPGIGIATAKRFAREGFKVILSSRSKDKGRHLAEKLQAEGYAAEYAYVDATDTTSVRALVSQVAKSHGQIDVLHYNAAALRKATLKEQAPETFYTDQAVNIGGALVAAQAVAEIMEKAGAGSILLTGGHFGVEPSPEFLSLSIGKAAIRAMTLGLFEQMKSQGVHVATVTVAAYVSPDSPEAAGIADTFMTLHTQPRENWVAELDYSAPHTITE
jgi:NAD(P)-dependent dehydrogenase (short-subunit alcohol dehydrogenase family)